MVSQGKEIAIEQLQLGVYSAGHGSYSILALRPHGSESGEGRRLVRSSSPGVHVNQIHSATPQRETLCTYVVRDKLRLSKSHWQLSYDTVAYCGMLVVLANTDTFMRTRATSYHGSRARQMFKVLRLTLA